MKRRTVVQLLSSLIAIFISGCHHTKPECKNVISNIKVLSDVEHLDKIECR